MFTYISWHFGCVDADWPKVMRNERVFLCVGEEIFSNERRHERQYTIQYTSNGGCRREEKSSTHLSFFTKLLSLVTENFFFFL